MVEIVSIECDWLDNLEKLLSDPSELLMDVGTVALAAMHDNVEAGGKPPKPLKPSTVKEKARKGQGSRPLLATGGLLDSLLPHGQDSVLEISGDTVTVGSGKPYAAAQDKERPFTVIEDRDLDAMADVVLTNLNQ